MHQIDLVRERLEPVNGMVRVFLPLARGRSLAAMEALGVTRRDYPSTYARCFTSSLRQMLVEDGLRGWEVVDGSDCLHLLDESGLRIRFLKELVFGGLPPAGRNRSRIEAWSQEGFDLFSPTEGLTRHPLGDVELIVVWAESGGRFSCTAYQPLAPGSWPKGAPGRAIMKMPLGIDPDVFEGMSFGDHGKEELLIPKANAIIQEHQRTE